MPLRLKQLELHGYKTFATKSEFAFSEGISAIVGPNGSGKSNIVDSIRWVLGEQSYGLLRGKKTEDMIFAGSELRPRAGMAQATLIFDNSDGWLPIEFSEVSISRRAYRDGENEYLLNGQRVRLRDISELLARCGLSERTYTIIGQGLIDTALSLKAEERRALFEEAAGIGAYRNKREDALRKLDSTQRNLERVLDILTEIKPRLRSLERQAQRARDYNQVRDDLHSVLKLWYGYHWFRAIAGLDAARSAADQTASELAVMLRNQQDYDHEVARLRAGIAQHRTELNAGRDEAAHLHAERELLARETAVGAERQRSLSAQRAALLAELPPLETQLAEQAERVAAAQADLAGLTAEASQARLRTQAAAATVAEREDQRGDLHQREAEARAELARLDALVNERRAQSAQQVDRAQRLEATRHEQQQTLTQLIHDEVRLNTAALTANAALLAQQNARARSEALAAERDQVVAASESGLLAAAQRVAANAAELERVRARRDVLEQARAQWAGFGAGAKALLAQGFPTRGALAELLAVPPELETAVSAALGAYLEALVIDDYAAAEAAVAALGAASGRVALLPLRHLRASQPPSLPGDHPAVVGLAARLLTVPPDLRPAIDLLLGRTLIVRDSVTAREIASGSWIDFALPDDALVVTLAGDIFAVAGPVFGGREAAPGMLEQARERRELAAQLAQTRTRAEQFQAEHARCQTALDSARAAFAEAQAAQRQAHEAERRALSARDSAAFEAERAAHDVRFRQEQLQKLEVETTQLAVVADATRTTLATLDAERQSADDARRAAVQAIEAYTVEDATADLARWRTALAVSDRALMDAQTRANELERARTNAADLLADRRAKVKRLDVEAAAAETASSRARAAEAALLDQIRASQERLAPLERLLAGLEAEQARVEAGDAAARANLHAAEHHNSERQLEHARRHEGVEAMRRRIEEDFGLVELDYGEAASGPTPLPLYSVVERLDCVEELAAGLDEQLNRKRGQLRRMGLINPDAEREYLEVSERHEFLTTQVADLEAAQLHLREVVTEMDVLMDRDFRRTFDAVAVEFRDTFAQLFGGGGAKLMLTDPEHVATTGVEIQARLPGRRPQSLAMLSGGERSLTACALVFALLRVSPTPFCVLDEVDAMLDEANVSRYRDMLLSLADQTQFIIVTHNRNTVQVADTVYGITMGADSASQIIGLKLEAEKLKGPQKAAEAVPPPTPEPAPGD